MLEVGYKLAQRGCTKRIGCVATAARWGDVVGFVDDQEVVAARVARLTRTRERLAEAAEWSLPLQVVHRGDQAREVRPRVHVNPAAPAQVADEVAVDDQELEPELVAHLVPPLRLQVGRADDEDAARAVAKDQLLGDEPGLDRLPQSDV